MSPRLSDALVIYAAHRDLRQSTLEYYERTVRGFSMWLGRPAVESDLDGETISRYLAERKGQVSDRYRKNIRSALRSLQKHYGQAGEVCHVRAPPPMVQGNTKAEISRIRDVSWRLDIMPERGMPASWPNALLRSVYFRAYITLLFESCLRPSDVHSIRTDRCRPGKRFGVSSSKTGEVVVISLSETACKLIELIGDRTYAVPTLVSDDVLRDWLKKTSDWAGVAYHARQGVRRSASTAREIAAPGTGHLAAGNSRAVFERHYLIREHVQAEAHGPGEL